MNQNNRNISRRKRARRIRAKVSGSAVRPRISVFRSLRGIYAQAIDDATGKTVIGARSTEITKKTKGRVELAEETGKLLADKCLKAGIKEATFDRSGYRYHGRIKALAEGARAGGLKF